MKNQVDIDRTDFAGFLYEIGCQLKKEGDSLQALGKIWFQGSEEYEILKLYGLNMHNVGKQLLAVRERLCKDCKLKEVATYISFDEDAKTNH